MDAHKNTEKRFGLFLKEHRTEHAITLEQLSDGLCSASELARIEAGTRIAGKALRDSLLYRLGISPDAYEHFLFAEDYTRWKRRQQLLYLISRGDTAQAKESLAEYRQHYEAGAEKDVDRRLERQFCLSMEAQLLSGRASLEEADAREQKEHPGKLFREALEQTVAFPSPTPVSKQAPPPYGHPRGVLDIPRKICSVQELNLLLEALRYEQPPDWETCYKEILNLIGESRFDAVSRAKIYPKAVFYLCREGLSRGAWGLAEKTAAMAHCEKAVQLLREAGRMYYLWELLGLLQTFLQDLAAGQLAVGAVQKAAQLEERRTEYGEWMEALVAVYMEFGVPRETTDFCWLYVEKEVYCINDIVRIRREMLGITRTELCENGILCSERTLRRLEEDGKKIQDSILNALMERLNLSAEYCQAELATSSPEALASMAELRDHIRNWDTEQTDRLLERLRELISLEIPSNRQEWIICHAINEAHKGTITSRQCAERIKEALSCTLPYEIAVKPGAKYLTNKEINCIHSMVNWTKGEDEEKGRLIALLAEQYEACERDYIIFCFINMYELVMDSVASEVGDMGQYDRSDEISLKIITECLYQRRSFGVHGGIYNLMWNNEQREKEGIPVRRQCNPEEDLKHCLVFSIIGKEKHFEEFYRRKLQNQKKHTIN